MSKTHVNIKKKKRKSPSIDTAAILKYEKAISDIIGLDFADGNITVLSFDHYEMKSKPEGRKRFYFKCRCNLCGKEFVSEKNTIKTNQVTSCGCLKKSADGESTTSFYNSFHAMHSRCENPNDKSYNNYGGRGIQVCDRWSGYNGYRNFKADMYDEYISKAAIYGEKYVTIDRRDVDGNYSKENCRWANSKEQANNKRNTPYLDYNGESLPIQICVDKYRDPRIPKETVLGRLKKGVPLEQALHEIPKRHYGKKVICPLSFREPGPTCPISFKERGIHRYQYNGETLTTRELYDKYGDKRLSFETVRDRIQKKGWDLNKALHEIPKFSHGAYGDPIICPISFREPDNITLNFSNNNCIES